MNGSSRYIVIELMIKSLSDFIERLFIGNGHVTLKENDLKKSLKTKADLYRANRDTFFRIKE